MHAPTPPPAVPPKPASRFILLEGPDGVGKTTIAKAIEKEAHRFGFDQILLYREPGGSALGEELRKILKSETVIESQSAVFFMMLAAREEGHLGLMRKLAANPEGLLIVMDRGFLSTLVYQSETCLNLRAAGNKGLEATIVGPMLRHRDACRNSLVVLLDAQDSLLDSRIAARNTSDRFEQVPCSVVQSHRESYRQLDEELAHEHLRSTRFHVGSQGIAAESIADILLCLLLA